MSEENNKPLFVTWNDEEGSFAKASKEANVKNYTAVKASNTYQNIAQPNVSVRQGYDRRDYDFFRPGEQIPTRELDIIAACMQSYEKIGIVRNTIDMMSEFACQGIDLVHPNPRIEDFYKQWFSKINGKERTERILNLFYRAGNLIVKRNTAKLKPEDADNLKRGIAADVKVEKTKTIKPMEIPWEYVIYNPLAIEVYGSELAPYWGQKYFKYGIRIPEFIDKKLKNPEIEVYREFISKVPKEVTDLARKGGKVIPLDSDKITAIYYKKDDWQVWARPMIFAIMEDLIMLRKMKLADLSALDGAVSHIRMWRLGSLDHKIMPTENAIARLAEMLMNNVGGGTMDLIWGPELDFKESSVDISKFLGEEKYKPVLNNIFAGLGIPPGLTGLSTSGGFSNNYIGLRTLVERLEYGRDKIVEFWTKEIKIVQQAMGFRQPAQLVFDKHVLSDEAAMLRLLVEMSDRNLISDEAIQERFDLIPEIERVRLNRETRRRESETMPPKLGPFSTDTKEAVKKIFAQNGRMGPSDFNIEASDAVEAEPKQPSVAPPNEEKPKGKPGQGRPNGKKDDLKRNRRTVKPVNASQWYEEKYYKIEEITTPAFLASVSKASIEDLSDAEYQSFENFKIGLLSQFMQKDSVTKQKVQAALSSEIVIPKPLKALIKLTEQKLEKKQKRPLEFYQKRKIALSAYAIYAGDNKMV